MEVANDKLAHQWEDWLKKDGFETVYSHAGHEHGPGEAEEVSCVLPN